MTTQMEIDEATGLPKLPKDHWWEVSEETDRISRWGVQIAIRRRMVIEEWVALPREFKDLFRRNYKKVSREVFSEVATKPIKINGYSGVVKAKVSDLSAALIRDHAVELWRDTYLPPKGSEFLGEYPPNKLPVVEELFEDKEDPETENGFEGSYNLSVIVHSISEDGFPEMSKLTGRVAFIWDGALISGWPIGEEFGGVQYGEQLWTGSEDRFGGPYMGVTHWVEFPVPVWEL